MKIWPFHQHRYFEVDRQWLERGWWNTQTGEARPDGTPITQITERCTDKLCGKYRQQTLVGHLPGGRIGNYRTPEGQVVIDE